MLENSLFNSNLVGSEGFYWWIGQVVDNKTWNDNIVKTKFINANEIKGFGSRYKVRIFGHHTDKKDDIKDMDLPWAQAMLPITAGGGQMSASQTPNIKQGNIVFGFFLDGIEAQQPIIMGILGNNAQTSLEKKIPEKGFIPTSGFANGERVPGYAKPAASNSGVPSGTTPGGGPATGKGSASNGAKPLEGDGANINQTNNNDLEQVKDGNIKTHLAKTQKCGGNDLDGIQLEIEKLMKQIERVKSSVDQFQSAVNDAVSNAQEKIKELVGKAAKFIARFMKTIIDYIRKYIIEFTREQTKKVYYLLMPNERPTLKKAEEKILDLLGCLFNLLIDALIGMITNALNNALDQMVNVASCAVENIMGSLLGEMLGFIDGAVNSILGPLNSLLSTFGAAVSFGGQILGLLSKLLGFLTCDKDGECPEANEWSMWSGIGDNGGLSGSLQGLFDQAKAIGSQITDAVDIDNFNFSSLGSNASPSNASGGSCNVGPQLCGPPAVSFFGSGSGAKGNAIVSPTGSILGIDVISTGSGYSGTSTVSITDPCGQGAGAIGKVILGPSQPPNSGSNPDQNRGKPGTGILEVVMIDPGSGYLPKYNGSQGGMQRTWADNYQTTVYRGTGRYDRPYNPGIEIQVCPGDTVTLPFFTTAEIYDSEGNSTETLVGGKNIVQNKCGTLTTPRISDEDYDFLNREGLSEQAIANLGLDAAVTSKGTYPVITKICDVFVKDGGINYNPNVDKITISPTNGAVLEPVFGEFGRLVKVNVISSGEGFTETPDIYIESETGYNALIIPLMCVNRIGDDLDGEEPDPTKVIQVIDCVGKV